MANASSRAGTNCTGVTRCRYAATMSDDLRKQRSESSEGKGLARRAWDRYAEAANSVRPGWVDDAVKRLAGRWTADLMGFWMSWHLHGGFEGLERAGWHRATIYRKLKRF